MDKGWVRIDRSICDSWLWQEKPFDKRSAWIDLILLANYRDNKIYFDGKVIEIRRGELHTSILHLADRWGWNRKTVTKFLNVLQNDKMIEVKSSKHGTTINIVKYTFYQGLQGSNCCVVDNGMDNAMDNGMDNAMDTTKERKKRKERKNNIFCQIEQQEYDIDAIERELLSN